MIYRFDAGEGKSDLMKDKTLKAWTSGCVLHNLLILFALFLLICSGLLASSCSTPISLPDNPTYPVPTESIPAPPTPLSPDLSPTFTPPSIQASPTILSSPTPPKAKNRTHYQLEAVLDYPQHMLSVSETITYTNDSGEALDSLVLVVEPALQEGVFHLSSIHGPDGKPLEPLVFDQGKMTLPLKLAPGENRRLSIVYELHLTDGPGVLGFTSRQVNLGDWYPYIPPFKEGVGWQVHYPGSVGEYQVYDAGDYAVSIRLVGAPPHTLIAASAEAQMEGDTYRYRIASARSFAWSASDSYQVFNAQAQTSYGDVQVKSYVFPEHVQAGERAPQVSAQALVLYAELFGPPAGGVYPHPSLAVVEADFFDGMEYDGLYFLGRDYYDTYDETSQNYLVSLSAHETAHQWWYGIVGNDQAMEPWLDEAFSTYCERLFYQRYYPELVSWWWEFRVNRFIPQGWVDSSIYDHSSFRPYVNAVYLRGALFLEQLRAQIGDEAFFGALREYTAAFAGRQASTRDFFDIIKKHTGIDFSLLVSNYFKQIN